jgi:DnaJ-class molecular chaperone
MAADDSQGSNVTEPTPCSPCRGTGRVISNLGGSPHEEPCPWCEGTGRFIPDHDAQARHRSGDRPEG